MEPAFEIENTLDQDVKAKTYTYNEWKHTMKER
jgi:hypothetical protein